MQRDRARSSPNLTFGVRSSAPPGSRPPGVSSGGYTSSPVPTPTGGGSISGAPPPLSGPPQRRKSSIRIAPPAAPPPPPQPTHHHHHHHMHHDDIPLMESDEGSVGSEQHDSIVVLPPPPKQPTRRASVAAMQRGGTPQEFDDYYYSNGRSGGGGPQEELAYRQGGGRGAEANVTDVHAAQQIRSFQFPSESSSFAGGSPSYPSGASAAARRSPPSSVHLSAGSPQRPSQATIQGQTLSSSQLGVGTRPSPSPQLHTQVPPNPLRNPHAKVSGVELHAPLPRLQATSERAADRTRDMVFQFMEQLCPERAAAVQKVMDQFSGREALLMEAITSIFGDEWATHQRRQQTLMLQQAAEDDAKAFLPVAYRHVPQAVRTTDVLLAPTHLPPRSPEYPKADAPLRDGPYSVAAASGDSGAPRDGAYAGTLTVHNVADEPLAFGGPVAHAQHPVGINSSRSQTPSHGVNPLPPLPSPAAQQHVAASATASKDHTVRSAETSAALAAVQLLDTNDPIAAVMATPTAAGGIMTPPVPPELVYRGGLPSTGISSSTWR